MELHSTFTHLSTPSSYSFSPSFNPFSPFPTTQIRNPLTPFRVVSVASIDPQDLPVNSPQRLLKELSERKRATSPKKTNLPPKRFILRPPLDDTKLTQRFLNSPQLSLNSFPLLSSCLPASRLNTADNSWISEYLLEAKQALGYPLEPSHTLADDNPAKQFDTLLYMAFQHPCCERSNARHVRGAHSRLWFLGQYVLEMGLAEFFLQRYPRESPGPMRERVFGLIGKRNLPRWIKAASLQNLVFPFDDMDKLQRKEREPPVKYVSDVLLFCFLCVFDSLMLMYLLDMEFYVEHLRLPVDELLC